MEIKYSTNSTTFIQDPIKVTLLNKFYLIHGLTAIERVTAYQSFIQPSEYRSVCSRLTALGYKTSPNTLVKYLKQMVCEGWAKHYSHGYRLIKRIGVYTKLKLKTNHRYERAYHPTIDVSNGTIDNHRVLIGLTHEYKRRMKSGKTIDEGSFSRNTGFARISKGFKMSFRQMSHQFGYKVSTMVEIVKELIECHAIYMERGQTNPEYPWTLLSNTYYLNLDDIDLFMKEPVTEEVERMTEQVEPVPTVKTKRYVKTFKDYNDYEKLCVDFVNENLLDLIHNGFVSKRYLDHTLPYRMFRKIVLNIPDSFDPPFRELSDPGIPEMV